MQVPVRRFDIAAQFHRVLLPSADRHLAAQSLSQYYGSLASRDYTAATQVARRQFGLGPRDGV